MAAQSCWWRAATLATVFSALIVIMAAQGVDLRQAFSSCHADVSTPMIRGETWHDANDTVVPTTKAKESPVVCPSPKEPPSYTDGLLVQYGDAPYLKGDWDAAPIVVESHKLVFFTVAKVACTTWKQLFRRMMGYSDWSVEEYDKMLPWNPETNGLKYLYDYDRVTASAMLEDPSWTKAIFVREPKERFVSAWLDKVKTNQNYLKDKCCWYRGECVEPARASLAGFLQVAHYCDDDHWRPQDRRMPERWWPHINFVGHMETLSVDAKRLLVRLQAWNDFGATGWGDAGTEAIFQPSSSHPTHAKDRLEEFLADKPQLVSDLEAFYAGDYANVVLNITKIQI